MKATSVGSLVILVVCQASLAVAQTSLYIPGFDPQAITADVEGVDAQGRTTYRIGPGVTSGAFEDPAGIVGSATLVADATEAHIVYANSALSISLSEDCTIANSVAVCSVVASAEGVVQTAVATETAKPFAVQGGTDAALPSKGAESGSSSASTPTAGSGVTGAPSATGSGANPTVSGDHNGVGRIESSMLVSLGVVGLVSAFFL
ncbi:hypothetical protein C8Q77DRAFT_511662 [Trametes polyzona]|nr:hypothetical protein C8Q77DRAFT_511662 [Trametes polyzona]